MRALLDFAAREDVQAFTSRALESPAVQGVIVDYHPLWMSLWQLRSQLGDSVVERRVIRFFDWYDRFERYAADWMAAGSPDVRWFHTEEGATSEPEPPDPTWRPPYWRDLLSLASQRPALEEALPFVIKVCLLPPQPEEQLPPREGDYRFDVVFERRAPAELAMPLRQHRPVVGGVSIGSGPRHSGTLGGIVEDQNGQRWGLTCAHVVDSTYGVDQPAQCDNSAATAIGAVRYLSALQSSSTLGACNPYNSGSQLNTVDATLIEFDPAVATDLDVLQYGSLSGITPKAGLNPGTLVEMGGKKSGARTLVVGGLALTYRLRDPRTKALYCFQHLFEVRWPKTWRLATGRPVQRGDSGAWILAAAAGGSEWCGVALAGDRLVGYAQFAEHVVDWAKHQHSLQLRVV